jgi:hypothetical protein
LYARERRSRGCRPPLLLVGLTLRLGALPVGFLLTLEGGEAFGLATLGLGGGAVGVLFGLALRFGALPVGFLLALEGGEALGLATLGFGGGAVGVLLGLALSLGTLPLGVDLE